MLIQERSSSPVTSAHQRLLKSSPICPSPSDSPAYQHKPLNPESPFHSVSPPSKSISISHPCIPLLHKLDEKPPKSDIIQVNVAQSQIQKITLRVPKGCSINRLDSQFQKVKKYNSQFSYYLNQAQLPYCHILQQSCRIIAKPKVVRLTVQVDGAVLAQMLISTKLLMLPPNQLLSQLKMGRGLEPNVLIKYRVNGQYVKNVRATIHQQVYLVVRTNEQQGMHELSQANKQQQLKDNRRKMNEDDADQKAECEEGRDPYDPEFELMKYRLRLQLNLGGQQSDEKIVEMLRDWVLYKLIN